VASDIKKLAARRERAAVEVNETPIEVMFSPGTISKSEITDPFIMSAEDFQNLDGPSGGFKRRKINKADVVKSKSHEIGSFATYDNFGVVSPEHNPYYFAKIYEMSSPHYSAVQAKTANIVDLGYSLEPSYVLKKRIESATEKGRIREERKAEDEKQEILDWLDTLNPQHPFAETLHNAWIDFETTGNAFFEVGRTKSGRINYFGHIPSTTMRVRVQRDGFVQLIGNKVVFFRNFGDTDGENPITDDPNPNEVIHIMNYTPMNSFYGVPDIIAAKEALAGDEFASRFNLDYFEHKAVPRYIITLKGARMSETSQRKIVEMFETGIKGKNHRSVFIPLPPDTADGKVEFKMEAIESGKQDSSFNLYRKANMDEIFMAHRTPKSKVGYMDGVGLAAARDADKGFKEQVTRPKQTMLEKRIDLILRTITDNFKFQLNELTLSDEETQSKIDERYLRMQTIVPNEVRKRLGLPPIPDGDKPVVIGAQANAEAKAQANQSRTRDAARSAGATDSAGNGRNAQGDGRSAA
jgi:PBSX family phage portal protein